VCEVTARGRRGMGSRPTAFSLSPWTCSRLKISTQIVSYGRIRGTGAVTLPGRLPTCGAEAPAPAQPIHVSGVILLYLPGGEIARWIGLARRSCALILSR